MPVMPVVPDELAQGGSNYIESEPEPTETMPEAAEPAASPAPVRPVRPPKRVMPITPVVPDELAQGGSNHIETEPHPTRPVRHQPAAPVRPALPPKRVHPVIPVVPDKFVQSRSNYIEREPELVDALPDHDVPDYEFLGWNEDRSTKKRRRNKLIRFIIFETLAFGLLLVSAKLEVNEQFSENSAHASCTSY